MNNKRFCIMDAVEPSIVSWVGDDGVKYASSDNPEIVLFDSIAEANDFIANSILTNAIVIEMGLNELDFVVVALQ